VVQVPYKKILCLVRLSLSLVLTPFEEAKQEAKEAAYAATQAEAETDSKAETDRKDRMREKAPVGARVDAVTVPVGARVDAVTVPVEATGRCPESSHHTSHESCCPVRTRQASLAHVRHWCVATHLLPLQLPGGPRRLLLSRPLLLFSSCLASYRGAWMAWGGSGGKKLPNAEKQREK